MMEQSINGRLNTLPIIPIHKKATALIGIGLFFDLYDVFLSGVLSTVLSKQFHVSSSLLPFLLGASFLGMFLGSVLFGRAADRIGRKKGYLINLAVYSLFTFLGAFSTNAEMLVLFRFLAGLGLGFELPLSDVYLSELLPSASRGRYTAWAYTFGFIGVPFVGFLAMWLVPIQPLGIDGWRWLFILGALGAIIIWMLRRNLPESPRWLASVGRKQEAYELVKTFEEEARRIHGTLPPPEEVEEKATQPLPIRILFSRTFVKRTSMLYIFQILQTIGYYGFGSLVPIVLTAKGYTVVHSLAFTALTFIGYPLGSFLSVPLVERMERKWLIALSALLMGVFGLLFGMANSSVLIIVLGFLYTLVSNIFSNAFHIFQAEIFPTSVRATAAGSAYSLSRLMSGLMPFLLLPVLQHYGPTVMFSVVAAAMLLLILDVSILGPSTKGRSLDQVNEIPTSSSIPKSDTPSDSISV
jgi:putative MFS transporter